MAAMVWAVCPDRMLIAWVATHASAWGSPSVWKHQAAFHWVGRAARCLLGRSFSARPPAEPRGHLSMHVALQ